MKRIQFYVTEELYAYYEEHAKDKTRTIGNLAEHSMERYCSITPLRREKEAKKAMGRGGVSD